MLRAKGISRLSYAIMALLAASMVVPFWSVLVTAFSTRFDSFQPGIHLWPVPWSVEGFGTLFSRIDFRLPFANTLIVTAIGTALHVALATLGGFVLSQPGLPGRRLMGGIILLTLTIPSQVILVPQFVLFRQLHLLNTLTALIISDAVSAFSVLLMKTYFEQIPASVLEAARMDGARQVRLVWDFYLPMALPGVMTIAAFQVVSRYNMFTEPLLFITAADKITLQIALKSVVQGKDTVSTSDFIGPNAQMAGVVISILPLLIFYPLMQRYLVRGLTIGGVKG
ncbi:MAG: carbohydrate ABC transporter permease [Alphaproteobacteria bacterium]